MAWTVTRTHFIEGNRRGVGLNMQADAATQTVETGLSVIDGMSIGYMSCATGPQYIYFNSNATGTLSNGVLGCSGFTSGDQLYVTVYGR